MERSVGSKQFSVEGRALLLSIRQLFGEEGQVAQEPSRSCCRTEPLGDPWHSGRQGLEPETI